MYEPSENCSGDVVEAFKLDEDFDYDNIILTPKYCGRNGSALRISCSRGQHLLGSPIQQLDLR